MGLLQLQGERFKGGGGWLLHRPSGTESKEDRELTWNSEENSDGARSLRGNGEKGKAKG